MREEGEDGTGDPVVAGRVVDVGGGPVTAPQERPVAGDAAVHRLREAIRLTREYVGEPTLPALPGWEWFEAIGATGDYEGFGGCGAVLDPSLWGRTPGAAGGVRYCKRPAGHDGDHGLRTGGEA